LFCFSQKYQDALLYGKKENRQITIYAQGIPKFRHTLNDTAKQYPNIAFESDTLRIWNPGLQAWVNVITGGGIARNGLTVVGDTTMLGDSVDRYTYIQVLSTLREGGRYNQLRLGNRPVAQSLNGVINFPLYKSTYGPSLFYVEQQFSTQTNDIDSSFYNAAAVFLTRTVRDSTDNEFKIGGRTEYMGNGGVYSLNQYFPPRDTNIVRVGRDGQSGNSIFAQLDYGNYFGYRSNILSPSDMPEFPISNVRSSVDLIRSIDNTRTKRMYGSGIAGFNAMYKSYQTAITMSTYQAGNYWDRMVDYMAYGDAYPMISGATKAYTLGVAEVNKSFGFYARPHYLYTNTVRDGYAFVARGDSDYNHMAFLNIGPYSTLPTRATSGNLSFTRRLYVNGDMESTGNSYSFVSVFMGGSVSIPIAIGTEAGINFLQRDSALTGTVGSYLVPSNRALRGMYIRSEMYNGATMDNNSTGGFVQIETGVNHAFMTRWWRNGGMVVNRSSGITDVYRLYKKFVVNGGSLFSPNATDTVTFKNMPQGWYDSTAFKPVYWNVATGDLYKGYYNGLVQSSGLTINRIPYVTTGGALTDAATLGFNGSEFTFYGAMKLSSALITGTTTLTNTMHTVRVDASGGAVTVDLPDATTCQGRVYIIKLVSNSANAMTIDGFGSQTIDGATTVSTSTQFGTFGIQSNGTDWDIISKF
jgi:hypothetical protein